MTLVNVLHSCTAWPLSRHETLAENISGLHVVLQQSQAWTAPQSHVGEHRARIERLLQLPVGVTTVGLTGLPVQYLWTASRAPAQCQLPCQVPLSGVQVCRHVRSLLRVWGPGEMYVQQPGGEVAVCSSCSVVGLRCWAGVSYACVPSVVEPPSRRRRSGGD